MKKRIVFIFLAVAIVVASVSSCKKYEEDYGIMNKTIKKRLVGEWKITQLNSDTLTIKMSDYAMFVELRMNFEKDETGYAKFIDKGLGEVMQGMDWNELINSYLENSEDADINADEINNMDFMSLFAQEMKFKWKFSDDKERLLFNAYNSETDSYTDETIDMKILSLCNTDMKLKYVQDTITFFVLMEKIK